MTNKEPAQALKENDVVCVIEVHNDGENSPPEVAHHFLQRAYERGEIVAYLTGIDALEALTDNGKAEQTPQTVDVEALKREIYEHFDGAIQNTSSVNLGRFASNVIDHLASRGLLGTVPESAMDSLKAATNRADYARMIVKDLLQFPLYPQPGDDPNTHVKVLEDCMTMRLVEILNASPQPKPQNEKG